MKKVIGVALLGLLALPALAQDSSVLDPNVNAGVVGDAVYAHQDATGYPGSPGTEQLNTYVVDLVTITSSWGQNFRIAPLVKASKANYSYTNALLDAQSISKTQKLNVANYPFASYSYWNQPTYGVNNDPTLNLPGTLMTPTGPCNQFAVAMNEYTGTYYGIVGALVNYNPAQPQRLYVGRVQAAINGPADGTSNGELLGATVDSDGNIHNRGEKYGYNSGNLIPDNSLYRSNIALRNTALRNEVSSTGPSDTGAASRLYAGGTTVYSPPEIVPQQVVGRPIMIGTNYTKQYFYEQTAGALTTTTAHRPINISDNRGCLYFNPRLSGGGRVGMAAMLGVDSGGLVRYLNAWGVASDGSVVAGSAIAFDPTASIPNLLGSFCLYKGLHGYMGGNGLVGLGKDQAGRGLIASTWCFSTSSDPNAMTIEPNNGILVARFDPNDTNPSNATWTIAADCRPDSATPVKNGHNGTSIGRLARHYASGVYRGPSMSLPAFDSVGNVYFLANVEIFDPNGNPATSTYPYCLVRGVYDPTAFSYELEVVLQSGSATYPAGNIIHGANSDTNYKVTYISIEYTGGISPSSFFSGNVSQTAFGGADPSTLQTSDPRTLGGLVMGATITYDSNRNGAFNDAIDEKYTALLYIQPDGNIPQSSGACCISGVCSITTPSGCAGTFLGEGTTCSPNNCPQPTGACCIHGACTVTTQAACTGTFVGVGTTCAYPSPCVCKGDANCDGTVNWRDIDYFVAGLNDNESTWKCRFPSCAPTCPYANLDCSNDSHVNWRDIDPFVGRLNKTCP